MRISVYISGKSKRLVKYISKSKSDNHICFVFSDSPIEPNLKELLDEYSIDCFSVDYRQLGNTTEEKRENFSECLLKELISRNIDYCISFGEHILVGEILQKYKNKIINFHPALLPMYKGAKAIDQAVADDSVLLVGNTAHFVDEGIDTGIIIMQSVIPLKAYFDNENDYDVILDLQIEMMEKIVKLIISDRIRIINDRVVIEGADYSTSHIYPNV